MGPGGCRGRDWGLERMASKPLQHDAVGLLRGLLEEGVTARHYDELRLPQSVVQPNSGVETDREVAIAPYQQRWNPRDAAERGF